MSKKKIFDVKEADAFFNRYEKGQNLEPTKILADWLEPFKKKITKIAEIGCGNGESLSLLSKTLNADAYGIEPSKLAVRHISKKFPSIKITQGFSDKIPFNDEFFDLVHLGFFLYLVDRSYYLRSISEADRVLKFGGFLSIIDFDTPFQYSNKYKHKKGVFSHKIDNSKIFQSSGFYSLVNKYNFSLSGKVFDSKINERVSIQLLFKEPKVFKI